MNEKQFSTSIKQSPPCFRKILLMAHMSWNQEEATGKPIVIKQTTEDHSSKFLEDGIESSRPKVNK